jgi:hypothetical protein
MNTDDLIAELSKGLKPAKRQSLRLGLVLTAMTALGICVLTVLVLRGVRPDFEKSGTAVGLKVIFSAAFAAVALPVAARLASPEKRAGVWLRVGIVLLVSSILIGAVAFMTNADGSLGPVYEGFPYAFIAIPALATPAAFLIFAWYRRFAPTRLALAGASVGALSGGLGAMAYALICPVDNAGFVSTWYGASIMVCTLVGAVVGPRVLRW